MRLIIRDALVFDVMPASGKRCFMIGKGFLSGRARNDVDGFRDEYGDVALTMNFLGFK